MYDNERIVDSFIDTGGETTMNVDDDLWQEYADMPPQSWKYFYEAAEEQTPGYCVELAKSGRSSCKMKGARKQCGDNAGIGQGEVRCGSLDDSSGNYGRWNHLKCWRVPAKIWLGLPDPEECDDPQDFARALHSMNGISLVGFSNLPEDDQNAFVAHVMDKEHWAKWTSRKSKPNHAAIVPSAVNNSGDESMVGQDYHKKREAFVAPVPGKKGAITGFLEGKTVVLTGTFPEVGGGVGLSLGKDKVRALVERFGGRVTSAVSGKTDLLVVGKEAGHSKVSKAKVSKKCKLISLKDLKDCLEGTAALEDVTSKPVLVPQFSAGYAGGSAVVAASGPMLIHQDENTDRDPDKKPAAKKRKALDQKSAAAKRPKNTKKVAGKKKPAAEKPKEITYDIQCDGCGVDCTAQSWHAEETDQDYCAECANMLSSSLTEQCNGVNVE